MKAEEIVLIFGASGSENLFTRLKMRYKDEEWEGYDVM